MQGKENGNWGYELGNARAQKCRGIRGRSQVLQCQINLRCCYFPPRGVSRAVHERHMANQPDPATQATDKNSCNEVTETEGQRARETERERDIQRQQLRLRLLEPPRSAFVVVDMVTIAVSCCESWLSWKVTTEACVMVLPKKGCCARLMSSTTSGVELPEDQ